MDFSDKKILVTGGSRGIGRAIATGFSQKGARLAINYLTNSEGAELTHAKLTGEGHIAIQGDVAKAIEVEQLVKKAIAALGGLDIVVNNAGRVIYSEVHELTDEIWDMHLDLNVTAAMRICRRAIPELKKRPIGRIVNIGSAVTLRSSPGLAGYTASKHALEGLTRVLSQELVPNITANCIHPGTILSGMTIPLMEEDPSLKAHYESFSPMGRLAVPEDISHAALFLCLEASCFINGIGLNVDGGYVAYG